MSGGGARIGILGGGQLGMMLSQSAQSLGLHPRVVEPKPGCPASRFAPTLSLAYDDAEVPEALADCDVVTYEFENVPHAAVCRLAERVPVHPAPRALAETGDRLAEKRMFRRFGIPTAEFRAVDSREGLFEAARALGLPAVLKTRRLGYDGKGQQLLRRMQDVDGAWRRLGDQPLILESWVPFDREVSLIAVRGRDGEVRFWDPAENVHVEGILRVSRAPAEGVSREALLRAQGWLGELLEALDYVGVLAVEFFVCGDDWIANEAACRVHNSGHWTLEGAATSQFENHVRAVAGLPLGSTRSTGPSAMVNLVGSPPDAPALLAVPGARLHDYGKSPAPGRKLGHVTLTADSREELEVRLASLAARLDDAALHEALCG